MPFDFGDALPKLILAHAIGDFPLQTNMIFHYKVSRPWGVVLHVSIIGICSAAMLLPYLHDGRVVGLLAVFLLTHLFQDKLKIEKQRDESRNNMWSFLSDQFLHMFFIVLMSLAMKNTQVAMTWPWAMPVWVDEAYRNDRLLWMVTWYTFGTFGGHILLGYLRKTFSQEHEFVLDGLGQKWAGFLERAGIATGLWMSLQYHPMYLFIAVVAVLPRLMLSWKHRMTFQDLGFSAGVGVVTGLLCYLS